MSTVVLRRARPEDCRAVFEWRNAEETRRHFFDPRPLEYAGHETWFHATLADPARHLLVAESDGRPVGVVRLDEGPASADVDVYVVPGQVGRGHGTRMLQEAARWARKETRIRKLVARVLEENVASLRAFEKAGFRAEHRVLTLDLEAP